MKVNIWHRKNNIIEDINIKKENIKYLPKVVIPAGIKAYNEIEKSIEKCEFIVLAVPSHVIRQVCKKIQPFIKENQTIVSIAKGIEEDTGKRLSEVIEEELPNNPIVVLSGPSHAEEVAQDIPTTVVVSSKHMDIAKKVQDLFMTNKFRVYTNDDLIGSK